MLVAAQLILLLAYFGWQRSRSPDEEGHFEAERVEAEPAPALSFTRRDGSRVELATWRGRPVLLHFWATWCAPCARELPELLEASRRAEVPLVAVSLDHDFRKVETFFGGDVPKEVVLGDAATPKAGLGVGTLPDTFLLDEQGRVTWRMQGERGWTTRTAAEWLQVEGR